MKTCIEKVTAFITQKRNKMPALLVFKHPTAGIQIPAGTVEVDEDIETAVKREACEETGLRNVEIENYLGCFENELDEQKRITTRTTQVYIKPDLNAASYKEKLTRGLTVEYHSTDEKFTHISYFEYDKFPDPSYIAYNISGWVPNANLSDQKTRHFFQLSTSEETEDMWELKSDRGHLFQPFWTPLLPKPEIVFPQNRWLDFVYDKIVVE